MSAETVHTLVIGGGQAGLAMSEHLGKRGVRHLILERQRIAERWRSERWDSLVANGPAWHDRFPSLQFSELDPDAFASKHDIVRYFETYAKQIDAPIRCGVEVTLLERGGDGSGFRAHTAGGVIEAHNVVVATGAFQRPIVPEVVPRAATPGRAAVMQLHSSAYKNPAQLPSGSVMVIGAGSSGVQIAAEKARAGRQVYLSVGPHNRPPRRYRGRDFVWWLGALGEWDVKTNRPDMEHITIAVSGANGGHTVDFRDLAALGITLLGRADRYEEGVLHFKSDLKANIARGDADYLAVLNAADEFAARHGLDLPPDPDARRIAANPPSVTDPILQVNLAQAGIQAIIWATGYAQDFAWMKLDAFDAGGRPLHSRGVSTVPGLHFLGLPWLSRRASPFIWGVWHDAEYLSGHIAARSA
jgi:putative flavoprotein involved in K+ transport